MAAGEAASAELDTREFYAALQQYAELTGKDCVEVINTKSRDVALKGARSVPKASASALKAKFSPRYIAAMLKKANPEKKPVVVKYRKVVGTTKSGKAKKKTFQRTVRRHYSHREARNFWKALVKRSRRSVGFVRTFFILIARSIEERAGLPNVANATGIKSGFEIHTVVAKPDSLLVSVSAKYVYRKRKGSKKVVDEILAKGWQDGMKAEKANIEKYLERKMQQRAKQFSAK